MEKFYINWEEFHIAVKQLCKKIKESGVYDKIVAISRGGLIPAGIIAYELNIRNTEVINAVSYDGNTQRSEEDSHFFGSIGIINDKTLIVDDLVDTGRTFRILRRNFPEAKYISVYTKAKGKADVDLYATEIPEKWIVFPWD